MSSNMSENILTERNYKPSSNKHRIFASTPDDEIVISGIAGRYPSCDNVGELRENLFNKVGLLCCCCCFRIAFYEYYFPNFGFKSEWNDKWGLFNRFCTRNNTKRMNPFIISSKRIVSRVREIS